MRIVVIGETGQLAQRLAAARGERDMIFLGRSSLDLAKIETIEPALTAAKPDVIVNAAAYTAVDQAEDERDLALAVNATGPGEAARVAGVLGVPFLHVSTDYVFDGSKDGAYVEADPVAPLGVYGTTKEAGEQAVRAATPMHAIYRTAWVYAPEGKNFVKTMLRLAADRDELRVVGDQFGSPTSATDLAAFILHAAETCARGDEASYGTFHVAGTGSTSWAGFAEAITQRGAELGLIDAVPVVTAITTAEFPTKAARPANSVLDCGKSLAAYGFEMPDWKASLNTTLTELRKAAE